MLGKPIFAAVAVAALLPVQVLAQDITGATTLGFGLGKVSDGGGDFNSLSLDSQLRFGFGNGLSVGAGVSLARLDVDGLSSDPRLSAFNLDLKYALANGVNFGGYVDKGKLENDFFDGSLTSYGLLVGRSTDLMDVQFFVGTSDIKDVSGLDWTDVGLSASTSLGDAGVIGGHIVNSHLSGGGMSGDLTSVGLGAAYGFGNGLTGFGGVNFVDMDGDADLTTLGIGLGYDLTSWTNMPLVASLEVSRSRLSASGVGSIDADTVSFGLTMPLGGNAAVAPQNSVAAAAMEPRRNALSTALLGMF